MAKEDMMNTRDTEDLNARAEGAEMEEGQEMDTKSKVAEAVEECFEEGGAAAGLEGDAAIDAVIAKLEAMKEGDRMGGLGEEASKGMPLPEEEA